MIRDARTAEVPADFVHQRLSQVPRRRGVRSRWSTADTRGAVRDTRDRLVASAGVSLPTQPIPAHEGHLHADEAPATRYIHPPWSVVCLTPAQTKKPDRTKLSKRFSAVVPGHASGASGVHYARRKTVRRMDTYDDFASQEMPVPEMADGEALRRFRRTGLAAMAVSSVMRRMDSHEMREEEVAPPPRPKTAVPRSQLWQYLKTPGYWTDEVAVYPHFSRRMRLCVTGTQRSQFHHDPERDASENGDHSMIDRFRIGLPQPH